MLCFSTLLECAAISHAKLASGWALIQVNFDPIQEIGSKVQGEHSFVRLRYTF